MQKDSVALHLKPIMKIVIFYLIPMFCNTNHTNITQLFTLKNVPSINKYYILLNAIEDYYLSTEEWHRGYKTVLSGTLIKKEMPKKGKG